MSFFIVFGVRIALKTTCWVRSRGTELAGLGIKRIRSQRLSSGRKPTGRFSWLEQRARRGLFAAALFALPAPADTVAHDERQAEWPGMGAARRSGVESARQAPALGASIAISWEGKAQASGSASSIGAENQSS
jgi:hypothetical protein